MQPEQTPQPEQQPAQPLTQTPEQPVSPVFQPPVAPQQPKKSKKTLLIVIFSIIGALLLAGGIAAAVYIGKQPSKEEYADAKVILDEINARSDKLAEQAQASLSIVTSENVLGAQVAKSQVLADELKVSVEELKTEREKLKDHKVLNDLVFKQQYDEFMKRSDLLLTKASNVADSSPVATKVMFECSDRNLLNNIDGVIAALDNLMASLTNSGGAFNPDTLVPNFDNDPVNIACKNAVKAAKLPLKDAGLSGIIEVFGTTIDDTRVKLVEIVEKYKAKEPGFDAYNKQVYEASVERYTTIIKEIGEKDAAEWAAADYSDQLNEMLKQAEEKSQ